jgi:hypothetical protein
MGVFDMIQSFLNPDQAFRGAQQEAQKGFEGAEQMFDKSYGFLDPYRKQGLDQYGPMMGAERKLLDPTKLLGEWSNSYEMSPFARRALDFNKERGLEAASSMGLMGSSGALGNIQQGASDIMQKDRREYLNDLMQKYMLGIGLGQDIYGKGAQAAGGMTSAALEQAMNRMRQGTNMAHLKYGEEAAPGSLLERLIQMGANMYAGGKMGGMGGGA